MEGRKEGERARARKCALRCSDGRSFARLDVGEGGGDAAPGLGHGEEEPVRDVEAAALQLDGERGEGLEAQQVEEHGAGAAEVAAVEEGRRHALAVGHGRHAGAELAQARQRERADGLGEVAQQQGRGGHATPRTRERPAQALVIATALALARARARARARALALALDLASGGAGAAAGAGVGPGGVERRLRRRLRRRPRLGLRHNGLGVRLRGLRRVRVERREVEARRAVIGQHPGQHEVLREVVVGAARKRVQLHQVVLCVRAGARARKK